MMINSPYVENKIRQGATVNNVVGDSPTDEDIVKNMYARTFCRQPTSSELTRAVALLKESTERREGAQDLLWALVTAREFFFNH
jgi:hypothetical protein